MSDMFYNMKKLESIDVSGFDTSNVEYAETMFYNNRSFTSLDLSSWNTSKFEDYTVFYELPNLKELDISSFEVTNERYIDDGMFSTLPALERLKTPKSFTGDSSATLPAVFTDGTNNYLLLDSSTSKSTWIERTNKIGFIIKDNRGCEDVEACSPSKETYIANEGIKWSEWLSGPANTKGYMALESIDACPSSGYMLYYDGIGSKISKEAALGSNFNNYNVVKTKVIRRTDGPVFITDEIMNGITYSYVPCIPKA